MAFKTLRLNWQGSAATTPDSFRITFHPSTGVAHMPYATHQGLGLPTKAPFWVLVEGDKDQGLVRLTVVEDGNGAGRVRVHPNGTSYRFSMRRVFRAMGLPFPPRDFVTCPRVDAEGRVIFSVTEEDDDAVE